MYRLRTTRLCLEVFL